MTRYAQDTKVSSDRSRSEIERTLTRYGAETFVYGWEKDRAVVGFRMRDRHIKFTIPLPDRNTPEFCETPTGKMRSNSAAKRKYEQAILQRWRALALVIKAKLEAVESGICEFDQEFLAHIVLPSGETVGNWLGPQIEQAYLTGDMPPLLPGPKQ